MERLVFRVVVIQFWHGFIDYNYLNTITKVTYKQCLQLQKLQCYITGQSSQKLVLDVNVLTQHALATCFNSTWLAECDVFTSIELVIGNYQLQTNTCLLLQHHKLHLLF